MKLWDGIMIGAVALGVALFATSQMSVGQDLVQVPLPDISALDDEAAADLATRIARADVVSLNCPGYEISGGAWTLLAGTGDLLARKLSLTPEAYDQRFQAPAFALLDDPDTCARLGPSIQPLIDELVGLGGATEPAPEPEPAG